MLDLTTEFGQRADHRLREEEVVWFTTVTPSGVAQPNPVWFYWDGQEVIIYSQPGSYRIRNITKNKHVTLNLQGADALGNNVLVMQGEAHLQFDYSSPHPEYIKKYQHFISELGLTVDHLVKEYSVEIIIELKKLRGV